MTTVLTNPRAIELMRLKTLRQAMRLEARGLKRRGKSAYGIVKTFLKVKGGRKKVFDLLEKEIEKLEEVLLNNSS